MWFVGSLATLSLTVSETLTWPSLLPILMQESFWWWQCSDGYNYNLPLPPSSAVPSKPYGFCGHKAPWKKVLLLLLHFIQWCDYDDLCFSQLAYPRFKGWGGTWRKPIWLRCPWTWQTLKSLVCTQPTMLASRKLRSVWCTCWVLRFSVINNLHLQAFCENQTTCFSSEVSECINAEMCLRMRSVQ